MLTYVKRTTVKIPDALDARLRHEAERRNLTISEVSREAIEAYLGEPSGRRTLHAAGAGRSGRSDIAERLAVAEIATVDHRHFTAVRPAHVDVFTPLP